MIIQRVFLGMEIVAPRFWCIWIQGPPKKAKEAKYIAILNSLGRAYCGLK